ncbi:NERD domain-containing protein [Nocardia sp. NPDC058497]|uniref:NERD domain-containing protein n=1 Tax=Nocardia sp. NPDC058497 TaxID=3346529 RepID=UPI00365915DC
MIVVVADETELEGAEEVVGAAIRDWASAVGGVAVFRCHVPESRGGSVEVDALVCTPQGATVVEVKGFTVRQDGTLSTPPNGPWTVGGEEAALYHAVRVPNPFVQVRRQVFAAKNLLQQSGIFGWVNAVVALVPQPGSQITLEEARIADGYRAVLVHRDDSTALHDYFHAETGRTVRLSVNDVRRVFAALNLSQLLPSRVALADQGFPARLDPSTTSRPAAPASIELGDAEETDAVAGGSSRVSTRLAQASTPAFLAAIDRLAHRPHASAVSAEVPEATRGHEQRSPEQESGSEERSETASAPRSAEAPGGDTADTVSPLAGLVSAPAAAEVSQGSASPNPSASIEPAEHCADRAQTRLPVENRAIQPNSAQSAQSEPAGETEVAAGTSGGSASPDDSGTAAPPEDHVAASEADMRADETGPTGADDASDSGVAEADSSVGANSDDDGDLRGEGVAGEAADGDNATANTPSPDETTAPAVDPGEGVTDGDTTVTAPPTDVESASAVSLTKSAAEPPAEASGDTDDDSAGAPAADGSAASEAVSREIPPEDDSVGGHESQGYGDSDYEPWEDPEYSGREAPGAEYAAPAATAAVGAAAGAAAAWSSSSSHDPDPAHRGNAESVEQFDSSEHWTDWVERDRTSARPTASSRLRERVQHKPTGPSLLERWRNTPVRERGERTQPRIRIGAGVGLILFIVLFGVAFFAITAVQASRFEMADYDRMCGDRKPFPNAAEYQRDGARPIYLSGDLATMVATSDSTAWHPRDTSSVQLIACMQQVSLGDLVQTCQFPPAPGTPIGRTVNLFRATYEITVYELRTGREAGRAIMIGERYSADPANTDPDRCRAAADAPDVLGRRLGQPSTAQVTGFLAPLVHADR